MSAKLLKRWWGVTVRGLSIALTLSVAIGGCGTYVPQHHEFWGGPGSTTSRVLGITDQVKCELGRGIATVGTRASSKWLKTDWASLVTITFNTTEKSTFMPGATITQPLYPAFLRFPALDPSSVSQQFGLSLGGEGSTQAKNKGVITFYIVNSDLASNYQNRVGRLTAKYGRPLEAGEDCEYQGRDGGFLFTKSELHLDSWLYTAVSLTTDEVQDLGTGTDDKKFSISQTVEFDVVTAGSITPTWKLVRVTSGDSGSLFGVNRDRGQTIDVVMGPIDRPGVLKPTAQSQYNANLFRNAVRLP